MPTITPTLWLQGGLALILLVLLAYIAARRWHQARISATQYRTASGRTIERETRHIQSRPMATRRVRAGAVSAVSQAATDQALLAANNLHIRERATFAGRYDANTSGVRRDNPFGAGTRSAVLWFSCYEPAYLDAMVKLQPPAAAAFTTEDLEFLNAGSFALLDGGQNLRDAMHASTVQTTARHSTATA